MNKILSILVTLALLGAIASLSSCSTMHGLGEDIEGAGHAIQGSANQ